MPQSIEQCSPVEVPVCGVVPEHRAASAVAAACAHNEASAFPSAPQQCVVCVVVVAVSHHGEDSVAVGGQHCAVSAAAVRHDVETPIWVAANQQRSVSVGTFLHGEVSDAF